MTYHLALVRWGSLERAPQKKSILCRRLEGQDIWHKNTKCRKQY